MVPGSVTLTGTPGTGKSSIARRLSGNIASAEVGDLALSMGSGTGRARSIEVNLADLRRQWTRRSRRRSEGLIVGHLSHLLPIRDTIVLRCHPLELASRLGRARRGSAREKIENVVAEATDLILVEAIRRRRRIWEVDTSGRSVADVAREVEQIYRRRPSSRYGAVDWLADPSVTEYLLRHSR